MVIDFFLQKAFYPMIKKCEKLKLKTVMTDISMKYCFAVTESETALYSVISRITAVVPDSIINASLTYYSGEDKKTDFLYFVKDNLALIIAAIAVIAFVVVLLILLNIKSKQRADAGEKLISAVERDELTGLYSKNFFFEYAERAQK